MLHILGMGASHPDTIIDNKFLEDLGIESSSEWIIEKLGIESRVTTLPLDYIKETKNVDPRRAIEVASMSPTDLGVKAALEAIKNSGISKEQIGLIICNCCSPNQSIPSEAQRIGDKLGLTVSAFDVLSACPAFALHIDLLNSYKEERLPEYVLCVSTAALTQRVNYNDRSDSAIWGDGAAAWVVSGKVPGRLKVVDSFFTADPKRSQAVIVNTFGHFYQDGRAVRDFSVRQTVRLIRSIEERYQIDWNRDVFVGHQANATMLRQICNNRGIPPTQHWHNVTHLGNQAGAGAPAVIASNWNKMQKGQKVVVAVVGAGLSWGSVLLEVVD